MWSVRIHLTRPQLMHQCIQRSLATTCRSPLTFRLCKEAGGGWPFDAVLVLSAKKDRVSLIWLSLHAIYLILLLVYSYYALINVMLHLPHPGQKRGHSLRLEKNQLLQGVSFIHASVLPRVVWCPKIGSVVYCTVVIDDASLHSRRNFRFSCIISQGKVH